MKCACGEDITRTDRIDVHRWPMVVIHALIGCYVYWRD